MSEVSPVKLSHDSASRWLNSQNFRPSEIYKEVSKYIDQDSPCLLVGDDTLISKQYSKKIELVHYQYSGAVHDVIPGIGMVNLLHYDIVFSPTPGIEASSVLLSDKSWCVFI